MISHSIYWKPYPLLKYYGTLIIRFKLFYCHLLRPSSSMFESIYFKLYIVVGIGKSKLSFDFEKFWTCFSRVIDL